MIDTSHDKNTTVIIPCFNEGSGIHATLKALTEQEDQNFDVIFVDNNSTDNTVDIIEQYINSCVMVRWQIIKEAQQGTGAASDTGMREAIRNGAEWLLRTDADCVPAVNWVAAMKEEFRKGTQLVAGKCDPRTDEVTRSPLSIWLLARVVNVAETYGKLSFRNKGDEYKTPFMMLSGCNVGIIKELYEKSGGFMRTRIEDVHEDRELMNACRRVTDRIVFSHEALVSMSTRRVDAWGVINTLRWYRNHGYRPENVNIR